MDIFVGCLLFVTQCCVLNVKKLMLPQNICNDIKIAVRDYCRKQEIGFRVYFGKKGKRAFHGISPVQSTLKLN